MKNSKHRYYGPECEGEDMKKESASQTLKRASKRSKEKIEQTEVVEEVNTTETTEPEEATKKPIVKFVGRPVIDDVVHNRMEVDYETYQMVTTSPLYVNRVVDSKLYKMKLEKTSKPGKLISDLINVVNFIKFDSDDAYIMVDGVRHNCHVEIVRFLKGCLINQMNANMEYAEIIGSIYNHVMNEILIGKGLTVPFSVPTTTPLQEVIKEEVEEFFMSILTKNNIPFMKVVKAAPVKGKKGKQKSSFDEACGIIEVVE